MTRTIVGLVLVSAATVAGSLAIEAWRDAILGAGIATVLWIVASRILHRMRRFRPPLISPFDRALQTTSSSPQRPADLAAVERAFGWKSYAPDEFDTRIRPVIQRLVDRRLMDRRGIDLRSDPLGAVGYLGPNLRAVLVDRSEVRADTAHIATLIDEVEAL